MAAATLSLNGTQEKVWGGTEAQNAGQADDHKVNGARGLSRGGGEPSAAANNGILKGGEEMWCGWRAKRLKDKHDVGDTHTHAHMSSHTHTHTICQRTWRMRNNILRYICFLLHTARRLRLLFVPFVPHSSLTFLLLFSSSFFVVVAASSRVLCLPPLLCAMRRSKCKCGTTNAKTLNCPTQMRIMLNSGSRSTFSHAHT